MDMECVFTKREENTKETGKEETSMEKVNLCENLGGY